MKTKFSQEELLMNENVLRYFANLIQIGTWDQFDGAAYDDRYCPEVFKATNELFTAEKRGNMVFVYKQDKIFADTYKDYKIPIGHIQRNFDFKPYAEYTDNRQQHELVPLCFDCEHKSKCFGSGVVACSGYNKEVLTQ